MPALFIAGLCVLAIGNFLTGQYRQDPGVLFVAPGMVVLVLVFSIWSTGRLADRVELKAQSLRLVRGRLESTVPLADVLDVSKRYRFGLVRAVLFVANPGPLGEEIEFIAAGWNPL